MRRISGYEDLRTRALRAEHGARMAASGVQLRTDDSDWQYDPSREMPGDPFEDMPQVGRGTAW